MRPHGYGPPAETSSFIIAAPPHRIGERPHCDGVLGAGAVIGEGDKEVLDPAGLGPSCEGWDRV